MFRNFLAGMGSILELFPRRRDLLQFPKPLSDEEAIAQDRRESDKVWIAVGNNLRASMKRIDNERTDD